ncbi:MAG: acetyl/propionyl/methylcrotonyl-CoA carboxylase subunit alpha [Xanthomonadales bacterium]|nr:acetyl/propionyl/methylcrotonyl-CoA carboxylase subunit alpha [Gammaproteobacteria bacterium]MBT8053967.1 acetyl/propionyl/methylcrotonyl-CoA carboxylase subunit alpha [Gammaproteobacteria bacterium]NND58308.1 acetyl/propionyl/methylcrotonyl-CoA carboxylase subunit alpha [Xanthomonadales bacterium]NNK51981.1 acetyl/propionyl/methylcrotonyl-CoA carboxylase subunit alpha [Xanthomonadales bacterium]
MFSKILVANRGEIACRIIRTARRMGVATVAVYSDADREALHVAMADEAVHIGPAPPRESYLRGDRIIEACRETGAEAVHPGYGFLSENADFARQCGQAGVEFIGPGVAAIEAMGSKSAAKSIMEKAGVPLVPGYHEADQSEERLAAAAVDIGFPVLLKAVAGGGGKGMRLVSTADEFAGALAAARREASSSFGDDDMLVEKYLSRPRHVEVQVFCDRHGHAVYLFERDCSVQRRHQKIIEEAPAPGMTPELRRQMGEAAVLAARAIDYEGAGTVEFLLDGQGAFYFMEMNTRLQVEHPVTEMITGQDLVAWQLRVAAGENLPLKQEELRIHGHAFEARIYAEDPDNDFLPATGVLAYLQPPAENPHVRVDTGVLQGDEVSVYYDPMIAKLVVWDENRERALGRLAKALSEYRVSGLSTNISFLYNLATSLPFKNAELDTHFIETHHDLLFHSTDSDRVQDLPLASLYLLLRMERRARERAGGADPHSPWNSSSAWRLNQPSMHTGAIVLNGKPHDVPVVEIGSGDQRRFRITAGPKTVLAAGELSGNELHADIDGYRQRVTVVPHDGQFTLFGRNGAMQFALAQPDLGEEEGQSARDVFSAPMHGVVIKLLADAGAAVEKHQPLLIMEAMKMEHTIRAPAAGTVTEFFFQAGDQVSGGEELLGFSPAKES